LTPDSLIKFSIRDLPNNHGVRNKREQKRNKTGQKETKTKKFFKKLNMVAKVTQ
jgi:hypothetical protein